MGLLEDILARSSRAMPAGALPINDDGMETYIDYASGFPIEMKRKRDPFPEVPKAVVAPPLPQMAAQAGILAPGIGRLGAMGQDTDAPAIPVEAPIAEPVPLPRARPVEADAPTDVSSAARPVAPLPAPRVIAPAGTPSLAPVAPAATPAPVGMVQGPSILDRIGKGLSDNSQTLLALGAGFAGAPNIGQGISRAAAAAIPAQAADQKRILSSGAQYATMQAMKAAGVPDALSRAALGDPNIMKSVVTNYLGDRKAEIKTLKSKDAFGNETERLVSINPYDGTSKEITGAAIPAGGNNAANINHNLVGDDYLKQFPPETQSAVKAYIRGDAIPTGRQANAQMVKQIAQKYGQDTGVDASDQAYYQRKTFSNSLGDTKSGVGAQAKGFQQGLNHMTELADKLEKLGNSNGFGFAPLAHGINAARGLSTAQGDVRKGVDASSQALAGEIGKLYSGSSGGGVHERQSTKELFGKDLSGPEMAGALESTLELMQGGLQTIEQRRDSLYPNGNYPKGADFLGDQQKQQIEKVRSAISRLRGGEAAPATSAPIAPLAPGKSTVINGVTIKRLD